MTPAQNTQTKSLPSVIESTTTNDKVVATTIKSSKEKIPLLYIIISLYLAIIQLYTTLSFYYILAEKSHALAKGK